MEGDVVKYRTKGCRNNQMTSLQKPGTLEPAENPAIDKIVSQGVNAVWGDRINDSQALGKMTEFIKARIKSTPEFLEKVKKLANHHTRLAHLFDLDHNA